MTTDGRLLRIKGRGSAQYLVLGIIGVSNVALSIWILAFDELTPVGQQLAIIAGVWFISIVFGVWIATLAITVKVDPDILSVRLWPFKSAVVERSGIDKIESVKIDPLRDYGGWGIKGGRDDRLFGFSNGQAVRIHFEGTRKLTVLTDDPDSLIEAVAAM